MFSSVWLLCANSNHVSRPAQGPSCHEEKSCRWQNRAGEQHLWNPFFLLRYSLPNQYQEQQHAGRPREESKHCVFSGGRKLACNEILQRTCQHLLWLLMRALLFLITSYLFYSSPFEQLGDIELSLIIASFGIRNKKWVFLFVPL